MGGEGIMIAAGLHFVRAAARDMPRSGRDFLASDPPFCYSARINLIPPTTSSERAFTLLDLIVTLAVIAILALTLAPALAKSGGKAARVNCFSNKRRVQAACAIYSS